jgi:hypothetical protein
MKKILRRMPAKDNLKESSVSESYRAKQRRPVKRKLLLRNEAEKLFN